MKLVDTFSPIRFGLAVAAAPGASVKSSWSIPRSQPTMCSDSVNAPIAAAPAAQTLLLMRQPRQRSHHPVPHSRKAIAVLVFMVIGP
jgi:hypothetical protein